MWFSTPNEYFAVIFPRLVKFAVVVNVLTHTGSLTEPCQLTSVFLFFVSPTPLFIFINSCNIVVPF